MRAFPALLAAAAALAPGVAQVTGDSGSNGEATSVLGYQLPLCGQSKRDLPGDFTRRFCLRQCRLEESNKRIRPTFDEWEEFCRDTAGMEDWDEDCLLYMGCTYGCEVWGGDRDALRLLKHTERPAFLLETHANMYAAGITKEQRCVLEKCHAYCARESFHTCRETQFRQRCQDSNPHLYGCDVDCSASMRGARPASGIAKAAMAVALTSLAAIVAVPTVRW